MSGMSKPKRSIHVVQCYFNYQYKKPSVDEKAHPIRLGRQNDFNPNRKNLNFNNINLNLLIYT